MAELPTPDFVIGRRWQMLGQASRNSAPIWGVVDAARDEAIYPLVAQAVEQGQAQCLYDGPPAIKYARYAPYLLQLDVGNVLAKAWLARGGASHWGIFIQSRLSAQKLKRHLKHFVTAQTYQRRTVWVRFYDPRVLPVWLGGLRPDHVAQWFAQGAIHCCMAPGGSGLWIAQPQASLASRWMGVGTYTTSILQEEDA